MRANRLIPVAVLAFAAACSDTATSPTLTSVGGPLSNVEVKTYGDVNALSTNTPSGGHLQSGSIGCTVNADQELSCSAYEVAGIGHTNAVLSLVSTYSATIDCNNPGNNRNNPIESHTSTFSAATTVPLTSSRNGRLRVPVVSADPFDAPQVCPNDKWTPEIRDGTLELVSFTYTLTFEGFTSAAVTIQAP